MEELKLREEEVQLLKQGAWSNYAVIINCVVHTLYSWDLMRDANLCFELPLHLTCKHVFLCILGSGKCIVSTLCLITHFYRADLSKISHLNAMLIISNLEMGQHTFCEPQFTYISVTFMFTCNTHLYGTFVLPDVFLTSLSVKAMSSTISPEKTQESYCQLDIVFLQLNSRVCYITVAGFVCRVSC